MSKKLISKIVLLGFLSWLIPFAVSFLFYKPGGELIVAYSTFKCVIMLVGTLSGCYLLYRFFKFVNTDFIKYGILAGFVWFGINLVLDTLILIPIIKSTFVNYFMSIGLGYLAIPIISIAMGYLLDRQVKTAKK